MERTLRAALLKLHGQQGKALPVGRLTSAQRDVLDHFARQTGAITCERQGRCWVYRIQNPALFNLHLGAVSPQAEKPVAENLPLRAQNIAYARDSKARHDKHEYAYILLKSVGDSVFWLRDRHEQEQEQGEKGQRGSALFLSHETRRLGVACLRIETQDTWRSMSGAPLWLIENQALFDNTDWMPAGVRATLLYYGGQLDGRLLAWLKHRPRASRIVLFADYDGAGLANFARLWSHLGPMCEFWLMPAWQDKLARYGSQKLWQNTLHQFNQAVASPLPDDVMPLIRQMQQSGLALEQEAVWLPAKTED